MGAPLLQLATPGVASEDAPPCLRAATRFGVLYHPFDVLFMSANAILAKGAQHNRILTEEDIMDTVPAELPSVARDVLRRAWEARRASGRPSLLLSLLDVSRPLLVGAAVIHCAEILLQFLSPLLISVLIGFIDSEQSLSWGLLYAVGFFLTPFVQSFLSCHFVLRCRKLGLRAQGATKCLVFEKTLRLSQPAAASLGAGAIVNIMQVDSDRLGFAFFWVNFLWSMPLMMVVGMVLLWEQLSYAALAPLIIMIVLYRFNNILVEKLMTLSRKVSKLRDGRVKVFTEVFHAVRLCKMLGWEPQIADIVNRRRDEEMDHVARFKLFECFNAFVWMGIPALLPMITFGTYVLIGGSLEPQRVFTSLALIDMVRVPMNLFPQALQVLSQIKVGLGRIENLLLAEEMQQLTPDEGARLPSLAMAAYVRHSGPAVGTTTSVSDASFQWAKVSEQENWQEDGRSGCQRCWPRWKFSGQRQPEATSSSDVSMVTLSGGASTLPATLQVPSLEIPQGKLTIIVGAVGAGKSTLIAGLLNEVPLTAGRVEVRKPVAYCAQVPWIMHGTVQENILMGEEYKIDRFAEVIRACALEDDLRELQDGALTVIGERGINLSGGQKARVGLARAVYMHPETALCLFDDPLSAVDARVSRHLMEECLGSARGLLRHTTRVLVTHQLQYIAEADLLVIVRGGKIVASRKPVEFTPAELAAFGLTVETEGAEDGTDAAPSSRPQPVGETASMVASTEAEEHARPALAQPQQVSKSDNEECQEGGLSLKVWCTFARAMGGCTAAVLLASFVLINLTQLGSLLWLARWSSEGPTSMEDDVSLLSVYSALSIGEVVLIVGRIAVFRSTSLRVSKRLHDEALWAVLRSPMSWLDTTPAGRVVNRFSQDMQRLDMELQGTISTFVRNLCDFVTGCAVVAVCEPALIAVFLPMLCVYNAVQWRFRVTARQLQRLLSKNKSPIYQGLDEAMAGIATIRAFEKHRHFVEQNVKRCALTTRLEHNIMACNRWLALRLRAIGMVPIAAVTLAIVLQSRLPRMGTTVTGAGAGLVLRYALQLGSTLEGLLQSMTQTELALVSVERISEYGQLEPEPELALAADLEHCGIHDASWPQKGEIVFQDVTMRYRAHLPPVLSKVSFTVPGGTRVGVVGRTGAGKTSLLQALFRMCALESGKIWIDGVDIGGLGLHTLRRRLAIIPQDPLGFTGSLRFNLDPLGERSDQALWAELEKVQLARFFRSKEEGLDYHLSAGGENLSVGQRQLVCAARAFLRGSRMLILDEATASVDFETDAFIQQALQGEAAARQLTMLTIAHRINTVLGSDFVLVMERGSAAEFGPPKELAADPSSRFHTFVHPTDAPGGER
jgi:ABC-type multidrug transport system fused ATPase/permease subunit